MTRRPEPWRMSPVPRLRPQARGQHRDLAGADQLPQRRLQRIDGALVGNDHEHAAAVAGHGHRQLGQSHGHVLAGSRMPRSPGGRAGAHSGRERPPEGVGVPCGEVGVVKLEPPQFLPRRARPLAPRLLGPGVARRNRRPDDVRAHARVELRQRIDQRRQLRRIHDLGRHDVLERGQRALVLRGGRALEDDAVDQLAGKPDAHPRARLRRGIHGGRHRIVERPVQLRQPQQRQDPGHRPIGHGVPGLRHGTQS